MRKIILVLSKFAVGNSFTVRDGFAYFRYNGVWKVRASGAKKSSSIDKPLVRLSVSDGVSIIEKYGTGEEAEYELLQILKLVVS